MALLITWSVKIAALALVAWLLLRWHVRRSGALPAATRPHARSVMTGAALAGLGLTAVWVMAVWVVQDPHSPLMYAAPLVFALGLAAVTAWVQRDPTMQLQIRCAAPSRRGAVQWASGLGLVGLVGCGVALSRALDAGLPSPSLWSFGTVERMCTMTIDDVPGEYVFGLAGGGGLAVAGVVSGLLLMGLSWVRSVPIDSERRAASQASVLDVDGGQGAAGRPSDEVRQGVRKMVAAAGGCAVTGTSALWCSHLIETMTALDGCAGVDLSVWALVVTGLHALAWLGSAITLAALVRQWLLGEPVGYSDELAAADIAASR